jgi:hypothetical protein
VHEELVEKPLDGGEHNQSQPQLICASQMAGAACVTAASSGPSRSVLIIYSDSQKLVQGYNDDSTHDVPMRRDPAWCAHGHRDHRYLEYQLDCRASQLRANLIAIDARSA